MYSQFFYWSPLYMNIVVRSELNDCRSIIYYLKRKGSKSELKVMWEIGSSGIFCKTELFLFLSSAMYYTSLV